MNQKVFFKKLRKKLSGFSQSEINKAISYYSEIINDKITYEHMSEKDAIASLGDINYIVSAIKADIISQSAPRSNGGGTKRASPLSILLCAPLLLPLALVVFALYLSIFVVYISLVASFAAVSFSSIAAGIAGVIFLAPLAAKLTVIGTGVVCFVIFAWLCQLTAVLGYKFINLITVQLGRKIFRRKNA